MGTNYTAQNSTTVSALNNELDKIETALEDTLSRSGVAPNAMGSDLDMNSNRVLNLPAPVDPTEPFRKLDLDLIRFDENNIAYIPANYEEVSINLAKDIIIFEKISPKYSTFFRIRGGVKTKLNPNEDFQITSKSSIRIIRPNIDAGDVIQGVDSGVSRSEISQLELDITGNGYSQNAYIERLSATHNHYDLLKKQLTEVYPRYAPYKDGEFQIDTGRKQVYCQFSSVDATDYKELITPTSSRWFLSATKALYFDIPAFTGTVTVRVFPYRTQPGFGSTAPALVANQWQTISFSVTNLTRLGTDGTGNYFYGIYDYVHFSDGRYAKLDNPQFPVIPQLNATVRNSANDLENPFIKFYQREESDWESIDLTPDTFFSVGAGWTVNGRKISCTGLTDGGSGVRFFDSSRTIGTTFKVGIHIDYIVGQLALDLDNTAPNKRDFEGFFEGLIYDDRIFIKRAFNSLTTETEILYTKQIVPEITE